MDNDQFYNRLGRDRIEDRQVNELIGLARGVCADGVINQTEVEYLQKWLVANQAVTDNPLINSLYSGIEDTLKDGVADREECDELFSALQSFTSDDYELGEQQKSTSLPLCNPAPDLLIDQQSFCFTGRFRMGGRKKCQAALKAAGGHFVDRVTRSTDVLVIGYYATESWIHSNMGTKILQACEWRDRGIPISIVSEEHWQKHL